MLWSSFPPFRAFPSHHSTALCVPFHFYVLKRIAVPFIQNSIWRERYFFCCSCNLCFPELTFGLSSMMDSWWTVWGDLFWISGNPESDKRGMMKTCSVCCERQKFIVFSDSSCGVRWQQSGGSWQTTLSVRFIFPYIHLLLFYLRLALYHCQI